MSLLMPDSGLLFWMTIAFLVVFVLLARFGFPVITRAAAKRQADIDEAMEGALEARRQLAEIGVESEALREKARAERNAILAEAQATKAQIVAEAATAGEARRKQIIDQAEREAEDIREKAFAEIRDQIAGLSIAVARKVMGEQLKDDAEQQKFIERRLKERTLSSSNTKWIEE